MSLEIQGQWLEGGGKVMERVELGGRGDICLKKYLVELKCPPSPVSKCVTLCPESGLVVVLWRGRREWFGGRSRFPH